MRVAVTLGKTVEEVMTQVSVLELKLWLAWFSIEHKKTKESMGGNANNRNPRRR